MPFLRSAAEAEGDSHPAGSPERTQAYCALASLASLASPTFSMPTAATKPGSGGDYALFWALEGSCCCGRGRMGP